jgi:sulfite exporter TauE/SafE
MILQYIAEGFALGLSLSMTCVSTCGPIYSTYLLQRKSNWLQSIIILLKLSGARFIAYALFGILAGIFGREIGQFNRTWFTIVAYLLFSTFLIISAFRTHRKETGCQMAKWSRFVESPFLLGLVTGINFCPSFLIAVTKAVHLSGPIPGAMVFVAFFFGSNLPLFAFAIFGIMGNINFLRKVGIISAAIVGVWFITQAIGMTINQIQQHQHLEKEFAEKSLVTVFDSTDAFILSTDTSSFEYLRKRLKMKRPGPISFVSDANDLPDNGYILVDYEWSETSGTDFESLKRPGRFVIVLPEPKVDSTYSSQYADRLIRFLDMYYFKLDTLHGSLFNMASSPVGRRFNRMDSLKQKQ